MGSEMCIRDRGGSWKGLARVELRVAGRLARKAYGIFEGNEVLVRVVWDTSDLIGNEAQLWLIDGDSGSWGHLLVDHVILY